MDATALSILSNPTSSLLGERSDVQHNFLIKEIAWESKLGRQNGHLVTGSSSDLVEEKGKKDEEETVRRRLPVASPKTLSFQHKNSSTRAYATNRGGSPSLRKSVLGRAFNENEFGTHTTSDSKYSRRDRLIALFKRIQVDISQGESGSGYYSKSSQASTIDDSSVETSVLEFLQQSYRETKVKSSKKHSEEANHKRNATNEKSISNPDPPSTKFTRPPSNFVKKSPIPLTTQLLRDEFEVNSREESSSEADKLTSKINGLKLSELKQLAKAWGIKGYSKQKKSELVELLKSRENV